MKKPMLKKAFAIQGILLLIALIIYGASINHSYNIDDNYVVENHELVKKGIRGVPEIFSSRYHSERDQYFGYRPLCIAIFAIETNLFGENTKVHHFINILLYAILIFALYNLMRKLWPEIAAGFVYITLLIYMVHPIHSEVVLSLKNREEILCFLFGILAWKQVLSFYDSRKWYRLALGISFLGLAFLAKETAVIFIAIIPLSIVYFKTNNSEITKTSTQSNKRLIPIIQAGLLLIMILQPNFIPNIISMLGSFILIATLTILQKQKQAERINMKNPFLLISAGLFLLALIISFASNLWGRIILTLSAASLIAYSINLRSLFRTNNIKIPKLKREYLFVLLFIFISGIVLSLLHFIPDSILPKQNAPVFHWQNPLFSDNSFGTKFGVVFYSLGFYLKLLFIPAPLRFYYGYAIIPDAGFTHPVVIISLIIHLALLYGVVKGFRKRSILSFAILFYFIAIFPFSNIIFPLTGIVGERLLFIPSFGFALALAYLIFSLSKMNILSNSQKLKPQAIILCLLIVIPFAVLSIQRVPDWKNRETLYQADIPKLEKSAKANNLYANYQIAKVYTGMKQGIPLQQMDATIHEAIDYFNKALAVDSTYANPYHNLGYIYMMIGKDFPMAEKYFNLCIDTDSTIPEAWMNRGVARYQMERYDEAFADLEKSRSFHMDKEMDKIFYYMGQIYEIHDQKEQAIQLYDSALFYNPGQLSILTKLRDMSLEDQVYNNAIRYQKKIIEMATPDNDRVWVDLGNYSLMAGDTIAAVQAWEKAFEVFPGNYNIGMTLSQYYAEKGEPEKSLYFRDKALLNRR